MKSASATERMQAARRRSTQLLVQRANAIEERNSLIGLLTRIWPAHLSHPQKPGGAWDHVVCVHSPAGQLAWTLTNDQAKSPYFKHLEELPNDWDGHKTLDKAARILSLITKGEQ